MLVNRALAVMEKGMVSVERKLQRRISRLCRRLAHMPAGCLSVKRIHGRPYAYQVRRRGAGHHFAYQGPANSSDVRRLRRLMEERRKIQRELRRTQGVLVRVQRSLAPHRFLSRRRHASAFAGLPIPVSQEDLGEVAPRVRASMALAEGRRSFAFL